jgi:hypothetical protein
MILKRKDRPRGAIGNRLATESGEDYLVCIFELVSTKGYAHGPNGAWLSRKAILSEIDKSLKRP